jgi:hypothetical protein
MGQPRGTCRIRKWCIASLVVAGALLVLASTALADLSPIWVSRYNSPASGDDSGSAIAVSPKGSAVFVTGASTGSGTGLDYATEALNASTGARLWVRRLDGSAHGNDLPVAVAVNAAGSVVFVTGTTAGAGTGSDYLTVAYAASTGKRLWVATYDGPAHGTDDARAMTLDPDGSRLYVTGSSDGGSTTGEDYATVAYNSATGLREWVRRFNGPANGDDTANAIAAVPDGGAVVVTGTSGTTTGDDWQTIAYGPTTGSRLWAKRFTRSPNSTVPGRAGAVVASPDSSVVYVAGGATSKSDVGHHELLNVVAYTASNGAVVWRSVRRLNLMRFSGEEADWAAVTPDGATVYAVAPSLGSSGGVIEEGLDASNGSTTAFSDSIANPAGGAALSPDGNDVWLAETANFSPPLQYYVFENGADAVPVLSGGWRYSPTGNAQAHAVAVSPDSRTAYITGQVQRNRSSDYDFGTIAIAAATG